MTTFKHNDKVTCTIKGVDITDARISINKDGTPFICQNEWNGSKADDKLGYKYSWELEKDFTNYDVKNLKLAERIITWDTLQEGDVMLDSIGFERIVLGMCGKVIFLGNNDDGIIKSLSHHYTKEELINNKYTIKQSVETPVVEELTVEQVCKLLGKNIKIVK